jgi:hypothetical protein
LPKRKNLIDKKINSNEKESEGMQNKEANKNVN